MEPKSLLEIGPCLSRALFRPGDDAQAVDSGCLAAAILGLAADPEGLPVMALGAGVVPQVPADNSKAAVTARFELQPASAGALYGFSRASAMVLCNLRRSGAVAINAWSSGGEGQGLLKPGPGGLIVPLAQKRLAPPEVPCALAVRCLVQMARLLASGQFNGNPGCVGGSYIVAGDAGIVRLAQRYLSPESVICQDPGKFVQRREILVLEVPVSKVMVCPFAGQ